MTDEQESRYNGMTDNYRDDGDGQVDDSLTNDNMWELEFDGWTQGEDAMYMKHLGIAQRTGDLRPLFPHWARMIRHWPYAVDPRNLKSYMDLGSDAHHEIIERINQGIRAPKRPDGRSGGGET